MNETTRLLERLTETVMSLSTSVLSLSKTAQTLAETQKAQAIEIANLKLRLIAIEETLNVKKK
jgi:hypothetical protein